MVIHSRTKLPDHDSSHTKNCFFCLAFRKLAEKNNVRNARAETGPNCTEAMQRPLPRSQGSICKIVTWKWREQWRSLFGHPEMMLGLGFVVFPLLIHVLNSNEQRKLIFEVMSKQLFLCRENFQKFESWRWSLW